MIICMNYSQDGSRTICKLVHNTYFNFNEQDYAREQSELYDEVYILDFPINDKSLINAIVLEGCRV